MNQRAPSRRPKAASASHVRLLPTAMVTLAVLLGLKTVALAEEAVQAAGESSHAPPTPDAQGGQGAAQGDAAQAACPAPSFADQAGLSQSEVQVLQALGARRQVLDGRAAEMQTEAELLSAAERRLDERLAELRRLESAVGELLGQLDESQEQRLANLVDVYQRMRAKDAAAVFDGLEDDVLVQVASRMRQQNLAEVMGRMEPTRARALTQRLAELSRPPADAQALLERARANPPGAAQPR